MLGREFFQNFNKVRPLINLQFQLFSFVKFKIQIQFLKNDLFLTYFQ